MKKCVLILGLMLLTGSVVFARLCMSYSWNCPPNYYLHITPPPPPPPSHHRYGYNIYPPVIGININNQPRSMGRRIYYATNPNRIRASVRVSI